MKHLLLFLSLSILISTAMKKIYTFSAQTNVKEWRIVNDGVMGGLSKSTLSLTPAGFGKFSGRILLENNGGFASVQIDKFTQVEKDIKFIVLRVKGDRKNYEFRLKSNRSQNESYVQKFSTSGEWQTIKLAINSFEPQFRGRKLTISNFNFETIEQMSFLIANKQQENFELLIDWIALE